MLSNDLFSYLDSDELSSPSGSPLFGETVLWSENNLSEFEPQGLECINNVNSAQPEERSVLTELTTPTKGSLCENDTRTESQKVIEVNMESDQEDELVKYLSGEYEEAPPPCLKLVRRIYEGNNRRGVPTSPLPFDGTDTGNLCMSKNAIAARETRQRKKEYMAKLEKTVDILRTENKNLKSETDTMKTNIKELKDEVSYLKSVLANQSVLAGLLQNIHKTPGVRFHSSMSLNQIEEKSKPKKPTASVTGMVKSMKSTKRKACEISCSDRSPVEESKKMDKRLNLDHGYAAQPCGVLADQVDKCVENSKKCESVSETCHSLQKNVNSHSSGNSTASHSGGGICLHVSNGSVSLEFCASCSEKAANVENEIQMRSGNGE